MSQTETDFLDEFTKSDDENAGAEAHHGVDESQTAETVEKPNSEATTAEENNEERPVPYKAMKAEREKRQEREKRIAELEAELDKARSNNGQAQPVRTEEEEQPRGEFWDNPVAFVESMLDRRERVQKQQRLIDAEDRMREKHPDYDDVITKVIAYGQSNPAAINEIMSSADPAKAGYQFGQKLAELEQMNDPDTYREKLRAEIRAEIEAELGGRSESDRTATNIPPDLSSARNVSGKSDKTKEADAFETMFPRK